MLCSMGGCRLYTRALVMRRIVLMLVNVDASKEREAAQCMSEVLLAGSYEEVFEVSLLPKNCLKYRLMTYNRKASVFACAA